MREERQQSPINGKSPKVSVCVITYQQEAYIQECLLSIINQVTAFDFEVLVGVDYSSDKTREIVQQIADSYPHLVHPVLHERNVGPTVNYFSVHQLARGEYVCQCDGDDYWLPGKLQWQATYLDAHPEVVQVWHRMLILNDRNEGRVGMPIRFKGYFGKQLDLRSLALSYGLVGQHSSHMYRRQARRINQSDRLLLDYYVALDIARAGKSVLVDRVYGVYRVHSKPRSICSTATGKSNVDQCLIDISLDYSTDRDLKLRFCSHLAVCALMAACQGRSVHVIWEYLRQERFPISPLYFFRALKIFLLHTNKGLMLAAIMLVIKGFSRIISFRNVE